MDDDVADAHAAAAVRPTRPWTTGPTSSSVTDVIRDIQQRIKRPQNTVRKSVALQRARQMQLTKMSKLNDDLRQEVKFAAAEALHNAKAVKIGLDRASNVSVQVRKQQQQLEAIEAEIDACQAQVTELKLAQGSEILQLARDRKNQGAIQRLENRLQRSLLKNNAMHAVNESFKAQQEAMRRDITIADTVQSGLQQQLADVQHRICQVTAAYDDAVLHNARSQETLAAIQRTSEQWHESFQADWGALAQLMADQTKDQHARALSKRRATTDVAAHHHDVDDDDVPANPYLKKQTKADLDCAATLRTTAAKQAEIDRYDAMFAEFRAATGIDDVDTLIRTFQEQEQETFRLFTEANELAKLKGALLAEAGPEMEIRMASAEDAAAGGDGDLGSRVAEIQASLVELARAEADASADLQLVTERIRNLVWDRLAPNQIVSMKEGLEILETFIYDLVAAYKKMYHIRDDVEAELAPESMVFDDSLDGQLGVEICIPSLSDAEPEDEAIIGRRQSTLRHSMISSSDNAANLFVRALTAGRRKSRRSSTMDRRPSYRSPSSRRQSEISLFDGDYD